MLYPLVAAHIKATQHLSDDLAELGYVLLDTQHLGKYGDTGLTYNIEGIGVIGISALDPDSPLFAVLATFEYVMDYWSRGDIYRSTRHRDVVVGKRPNPYPPNEPAAEAWLSDLYMNPHVRHSLPGIGSYCSLFPV